jgi:hypothetical protein
MANYIIDNIIVQYIYKIDKNLKIEIDNKLYINYI